MKRNSDETFALKHLMDFLKRTKKSAFQCEVNPNDPPDIIVTWVHGERWGVEVTRAYQQVQKIGDEKAIYSTEAARAELKKFSNELMTKTREIRRCDYTIYLEGAGPFSSWKKSQSFTESKYEIEEQVRQHIASGETGTLRFSGGRLTPGALGDRWRLLLGGSASEINSSVTVMLRKNLTAKTKNLQKWKPDFDQRWLLLLNCYPLADDIAEIRNTFCRLVRENEDFSGFDGIFWSGFPDRGLVCIPLLQ